MFTLHLFHNDIITRCLDMEAPSWNLMKLQGGKANLQVSFIDRSMPVLALLTSDYRDPITGQGAHGLRDHVKWCLNSWRIVLN